MRVLGLSNRSLIATGCGMAALVLFSVPFVNDPLLVDEAIFASTIRNLTQYGVPEYYAGEHEGMKSGLWHPPTYIYYVSIWFRFVNASSLVARTTTLLFSVLTVPVVALTANHLSLDAERIDPDYAVASAVVAYVGSPLVVQNATLIDIDGSVLALLVSAMILWVVGTFGSERTRGWHALIGTGLWFGAVAWVKFGVLPVLLLTVPIYVAHQRGLRRGGAVLLASVVGLLGFVGSWWLVSEWVGLSFVQPFAHNFGTVLNGQSVSAQKRVLLSTWGLYSELLWLSPFLFVLAAVNAVNTFPPRLSNGWRAEIHADSALLFTVATLTVLQYAVLAKVPYGFPKYLGVATPLFCSLAGAAVGRVAARDWVKHRQVLVGATVLTAMGTVAVGDPHLVSFNDGYATVVRQTVTTVLGTLVVTALIVLILAHRDVFTSRSGAVLCLIVLLVGTNGGVLALQASADYSTKYFYGSVGSSDAITATTERYDGLSPSERSESVLPVGFGFYVDGPFHVSKRYSVAELESDPPPLVVLRTRKYFAVRSPLLDALLSSERYHSRRYGSYVLFERTTDNGTVRYLSKK